MSKFSIFSDFFKKYGRTYLVGVSMLIMIDLIFLALPIVTGKAIDTLARQKEGLTLYICILVAMALVVSILKSFSRKMLLGSIRHLEFFLRRRLFHHSLAISTSYYEQNGPGKVMALMTNDVTSLRVSLGLGMMILVDAIFFGIFSFIIMAHEISLSLAAVTVCPMIFISLSMLYVSRKMREKQREAQATFSDLTEFTQETFLGMSVIRAFNRELGGLYRFQSNNRLNYEKNQRVALLDSILGPLTYVAPFVCYAISIYICGMQIIEGKLSVGDFVAVNGFLILIIGPIMGLGSLASVLQKGLASLDRLQEFLTLPTEPEDNSQEVLPLDDIRIDHLTFSYDGMQTPILNDLCITVPKGGFVGIVGAPGSGKSTLFKLLLRLQPTPTKSIYIGERDITTIPLSVLRRSIAYVPPVSYLLGTTIKENIAFGEERIPTVSVEEAARRAAIQGDLEERLQSERHRLNEGGNNLSGGQKQRINIARGIYKDAPYLLLDDSISALDTQSAAVVLQALRREKAQTLIFVSQRLEALREADTILVFKEGQIAEAGTHENLLAKQGEYYRLYAQQLEREVDGDVE